MEVKNQKAVFLGLTEREASGDKRAWKALDFVVFNENQSRRIYLDLNNSSLLYAIRQACVNWGDVFEFSGDISQGDRLTLSDVSATNETLL